MWPSLVSAAFSALVVFLMAWKNRASKQSDDALERRFFQVETTGGEAGQKIDRLTERLHDAELKNATLDGDLRVASAGHAKLEQDVSEIKAKMVHRDEWELQMKSLRENIDARFDSLHDSLVLKTSRKR